MNIYPSRDWTAACRRCFEFRSHVGFQLRGPPLIWQHPTVPAHLHQPCFSTREEAKYPSRELRGLAQAADGVAPLLQARELRSDVSQRFPARWHTLTHKTHLVKVIFKTASASSHARLVSVPSYHDFCHVSSFLSQQSPVNARPPTHIHIHVHKQEEKSLRIFLRFISNFHFFFIRLSSLSNTLKHLIGHRTRKRRCVQDKRIEGE